MASLFALSETQCSMRLPLEKRTFSKLVLYTPTDEIYTPCGACRQVLAEFFPGDAEVICVANNGVIKTFSVDGLLPNRFAL